MLTLIEARAEGWDLIKRSLALLAVLILVGGVAQAEIDFGRYHALVIGINDYQYLPRLETAVNDATAVADLRRQKYSFEVTLLLNPTRERVIRTMDELRRTLTENDNLLIYYAGHGVLDAETETGFWLPVDAEEGTETNWIDMPFITRKAKAISAKHVMIIADSCYSGTLVRAAPSAIKSGAERLAELERLAGKRSRTALVSGGLEPVTDSGGYGHSVFARAFLTALRENTEVLEGQQLFSAIRGTVVLNAEQTPQYSDIRQAGHDGGDFLFVPVNVSLTTLTTAASQPVATPEGPSEQIELTFWEAIKDSTNPADFEAYLRKFPSGAFAGLVHNRLEALKEQQVALATPEQVPSPSKPLTRAQRDGNWAAKERGVSIELVIDGSSVTGKLISEQWGRYRVKGKIDTAGRLSGSAYSDGVDPLPISGVFSEFEVKRATFLLKRIPGLSLDALRQRW